MKHWSLWLAQFGRGKVGLAFQTAFYLLATAGLVFALMTLVACDCNGNGIDDCDTSGEAMYDAMMKSANDKLQSQEKPPATPKIQSTNLGRTGALTGTRVSHGLLLDSFDFTTPITYTWYPPAGASNFDFSRKPEPGGPPFVFRNVPANNAAISVMFDLPETGAYGGDRLPELLTAQQGTGPATTAYFLNVLGQAEAMPEVTPAASTVAGAKVDMWEVRRWMTREGITVTTESCQQAVDLLQSDAAFLALQVPEPPHPVGQSSLLPIYGPTTLEFVDYDGGSMDVPGKAGFRPTRFTFVANALPAKAGHIWMALGAQQTPALTCPADKQSGSWEVHTALTLDLSYAANSCNGCVLNLYLCYEGQTLPGNAAQRYVMGQAFNTALKQLTASTAGAGVQSYRDWGITCAGPLPLQLINDPEWNNWMLMGASAQWITPTWTITLPHALEGGAFTPPALIDLDYDAPFDADWHWSDGTATITPPVSFAGGWPPTNVYLVGTVPAGTPTGLYTVVVTATRQTAPTDFRVSSDMVWVGEWSPPSEGGAPTHLLYLPLVLRNKAGE